MSYQVLARKWRPRKFAELVGQAHVVQALSNGLEQGRVHHAFLFTGTRGVGKTTLARILAKALNCIEGVSAEPCGECANCVAIDEGRFVDLLEIDAASRTKVDDTREVLDNVQYAPARGRFKVYLIDEVHMLSAHSFNALLKTLEEPPDHVKFVLATTDPQKIPVTILSRCLQFNLRRLHVEVIGAQLAKILEAEGIDFEPEAVQALARAADGSMRDALSLLDQALAIDGNRLAVAVVTEMLGSVEQRPLHQIIEALIAGDAAQAMAVVDEMYSLARDLGGLLMDLAETLHRISLVQQLPDYRDDSRTDWEQLLDFARRMDSADVQLYYQIALTGRRDLPLAPSARSGCQMTLLRMFAFRPVDDEGRRLANDQRPRPDNVADRVAPAAPAPATDPLPEGGVECASPENGTIETGEGAPSRAQTTAGKMPEPSASRWPEILAGLNLNGSVQTVAALLALDSVQGERWCFHADREDLTLFTRRFRESLEAALGAAFGGKVAVDIQSGAPDSLVTPAGLERAGLDQAQLDAEAAIAADPLVARLRKTFTAELIEDSIRPLDPHNH